MESKHMHGNAKEILDLAKVVVDAHTDFLLKIFREYVNAVSANSNSEQAQDTKSSDAKKDARYLLSEKCLSDCSIVDVVKSKIQDKLDSINVNKPSCLPLAVVDSEQQSQQAGGTGAPVDEEERPTKAPELAANAAEQPQRRSPSPDCCVETERSSPSLIEIKDEPYSPVPLEADEWLDSSSLDTRENDDGEFYPEDENMVEEEHKSTQTSPFRELTRPIPLESLPVITVSTLPELPGSSCESVSSTSTQRAVVMSGTTSVDKARNSPLTMKQIKIIRPGKKKSKDKGKGKEQKKKNNQRKKITEPEKTNGKSFVTSEAERIKARERMRKLRAERRKMKVIPIWCWECLKEQYKEGVWMKCRTCNKMASPECAGHKPDYICRSCRIYKENMIK